MSIGRFGTYMTHVLETGFEIMKKENPHGSPAIRGYNIIAGGKKILFAYKHEKLGRQ